jgi:phasin
MIEPKLEVPAELRDLAEKTIDQAEKAFGMFFDAANKSMTSIPGPGTEISRQALTFTEQNMKAAFEHARKLVHATDLQQAIQIQSEFLRSQFTNAGEHMRQITGGVMSAAKNASKGQPWRPRAGTFAKINLSTSCVALPNAGVVQARLPN